MNVTTPFPGFNAAGALSAGDIVGFRFPYPTVENCWSREPRPCLVIDLEDYLGGWFVELLPGTQSLLPQKEASDLTIDQAAFCPQHQGLGSWRFLTRYHDRVDLKHPGFDIGTGGGPLILGRAHGSTLDAIAHLRGQLQATRDAHIEYRRARRGGRHRT